MSMTRASSWITALTAAACVSAVVGSASAQWQKTMVASASKPSRQQCQQIMQSTAALVEALTGLNQANKRLSGNHGIECFCGATLL